MNINSSISRFEKIQITALEALSQLSWKQQRKIDPINLLRMPEQQFNLMIKLRVFDPKYSDITELTYTPIKSETKQTAIRSGNYHHQDKHSELLQRLGMISQTELIALNILVIQSIPNVPLFDYHIYKKNEMHTYEYSLEQSAIERRGYKNTFVSIHATTEELASLTTLELWLNLECALIFSPRGFTTNTIEHFHRKLLRGKTLSSWLIETFTTKSRNIRWLQMYMSKQEYIDRRNQKLFGKTLYTKDTTAASILFLAMVLEEIEFNNLDKKIRKAWSVHNTRSRPNKAKAKIRGEILTKDDYKIVLEISNAIGIEPEKVLKKAIGDTLIDEYNRLFANGVIKNPLKRQS
ncbi:hypothetical protein [Marinomonas sp. ef1]|uniref:hypothetical protein n=1 Tax=Marinomonas sp. ef1 TaxID=2005043 RepID=UPI000C28261A|nr:hypothetical protein [Marinomonas sp. ef1]